VKLDLVKLPNARSVASHCSDPLRSARFDIGDGSGYSPKNDQADRNEPSDLANTGSRFRFSQ
jgi:hypothetical protein